jgi:hypothetical protein
MITYILNNGEWIVGSPAQGEKFKQVNSKGGELISFYSEPAAPALPTKISKRAFLVRIDPEMPAIDLASIDNPSGTATERIVQAELRKFMRYVENSSYIDLSSTLVSQGLSALVSLSLLTTVRLNAIINDPVTEGEL